MKKLFLSLACLCLMAGPARAQIEISLSPQPEDIFKAVFGSSGNGYVLWWADVCNMTQETATVHAGKINIAAQKGGIPIVSALLIPSVIRRAEKRNWISILVRASSFIAMTGAILTASETIKIGQSLRAALPVIAQTSEGLVHELEQDLPDTSIVQSAFLNGIMELSPGACDYKLVMSKDVGAREPVFLTIE